MRKIERQLRERIKDLTGTNEELSRELEVYRQHFSSRLRWWIKLLGEGKTPSLPWLIENDAKVLHSVKSWWWG